ncbi:MAG: Hsp20/alpha crystallin family protein [Chitinophagaceae bacterium]|nr:MAG: Hsp20/alpha crystallin family protein [Chitinophagaceae bacterium]
MSPLLKRKERDVPMTQSFMSDFFDIDRFPFFENNMLGHRSAAKVPLVNVKENKDDFMIEVAAPGMEKKDFHVNVDNSHLTISCEKEEESEEKDERFSRREYNYNSFSRTFHLPETVEKSKVKARYENGVLKIAVPKKAEAKKAEAKKEIKID